MDGPSDPLYLRMLVLRCQTGDELALLELVNHYQPRLAYFVTKMLSRPHALDDLLQDIWLDVIRGLPSLKDAAAFPAWLYRIARDRVYRELRRRGQPQSLDDVNEPAIADAQDEVFDPDDAALVHACLDELSYPHREVLVLRFLEDLSYQDVAKIAGCDLGTVRSRLHYAKRALRQAIEKRRKL